MDPQARLKSLSTADMVTGGALLLALIAAFFHWITVSVNAGVFSASGSESAFHDWGWLYLLAWLAGTAYWGLKVFAPDAEVLKSIPLPAWQALIGAGVLMLIGVLLDLTAIPSVPYGSSGIGLGWILGLIASLGVVVGGYLERHPEAAAALSARVSSMSSGMTSGSSTPAPAPSAPPTPPASEFTASPAPPEPVSGPEPESPEVADNGTADDDPVA